MRVKIHYTCYLTIIMSFFAGFFKEYLLAIVLLVFHEIGHLIFIKRAKQEINIVFLPFGGIIKYSRTTKNKQSKEFQIALGGLLMNVVLGIAFKLLKLETLYNLNLLLTIFNVIPIFPLDGGRIMGLILSTFIPFRKSLAITYGLSIMVIIIVGVVNLIIVHSLFVYLALIMLLIENVKYILNIGKEYMVFLLDKYLNYTDNKRKFKRALTLRNPLNRLFFYYNTEFYYDNYSISEYRLLSTHFRKDTKKNAKKVINVI